MWSSLAASVYGLTLPAAGKNSGHLSIGTDRQQHWTQRLWLRDSIFQPAYHFSVWLMLFYL